ncbi:MAG: peptidase prolyl oligopeptidase active site domain protein [Actinomycetia bacterium]|nr:peptidase prolyl oligopeptidase active site domain protein [Actinomycetes bacterium]
MTESFPRQQARTRRFSLGAPRSFKVAPDGSRVAFLRSKSGTDPVTCLWQLHVGTGQEELVADPATLGPAGEDLSPQEKARRERTREQAGGIVGFATDRAMTVAAFTLAGRVYVTGLGSSGGPGSGGPGTGGPESGPREIGARFPALDPRPDPTGTRVAYVHQGALHVTRIDRGAPVTHEAAEVSGPAEARGDGGVTGAGGRPGAGGTGAGAGDTGAGAGDTVLADTVLADTVLADPAGTPGVSYGLAEFIAAEEMGRMRGYWWAPDGASLLVARVDETPVHRWHIADPAHPARPPAVVAYPSAGTPNADVSLLLAGLDGRRTEVDIDRAAFPYLVTVTWEAGGDPLIVMQSRDQRVMRLLTADPATGATTLLREDTDPRWVDIVPGVPARTGDGRIVWAADEDGARRLLVGTPDELAGGTSPGSAGPGNTGPGSIRPGSTRSGGTGAAVTPPSLQVREILSVDAGTVLFTASAGDPTAIGLWLYRREDAGNGGLREISPPGGVHAGTRAAGTTVLTSRTMTQPGPAVRVLTDTAAQPAATEAAQIAVLAEPPNVPAPHPDRFAAGTREIRSALLLPSWHEPGSARLPVLLDPYGGPHAQRVLAAQGAFLTSQWLAEQGFAVLVADGRGTPGRGPEWDRAVWHDLAGPVLEDQVEALQAAAARHPDLDTSRVAIRGWSFGGYLSALAVLRRPDVFHAAVAGAPVTDWRLYDTHYTERYLGLPDEQPLVYEQSSLLADAPRLTRPLLFVHGLADDNVVVAHTLRMSSALLAAGRRHDVLPLSGVTHMTPQEEVAENLLLLQVEFLREALGAGRTMTSIT